MVFERQQIGKERLAEIERVRNRDKEKDGNTQRERGQKKKVRVISERSIMRKMERCRKRIDLQ